LGQEVQGYDEIRNGRARRDRLRAAGIVNSRRSIDQLWRKADFFRPARSYESARLWVTYWAGYPGTGKDFSSQALAEEVIERSDAHGAFLRTRLVSL
jgi:hypothetical protein